MVENRVLWLLMKLALFALYALPLAVSACGTTPPPALTTPPPHTSHHAPKPVGDPIAAMAYKRSGWSYDEALMIAEDLNATKDSPELTDAQLGAPMADGDVVSACGAPDAMKVVVKVAVREGTAMGVTVATSPEDADVAACVDKAVRALAWPVSAKRFTFTTAY